MFFLSRFFFLRHSSVCTSTRMCVFLHWMFALMADLIVSKWCVRSTNERERIRQRIRGRRTRTSERINEWKKRKKLHFFLSFFSSARCHCSAIAFIGSMLSLVLLNLNKRTISIAISSLLILPPPPSQLPSPSCRHCENKSHREKLI